MQIRCWSFIIIFMLLALMDNTLSEMLPTLFGYTIASDDSVLINDIHTINSYKTVDIFFYGINLDNVTYISFTYRLMENNSNCDNLRSTESFNFYNLNGTFSARIAINSHRYKTYYFCLAVPKVIDNVEYLLWIYQGHFTDVSLFLHFPLLPLWLKIIFVIILLCFSGLFSGLNLGLMSLSLTDLQLFEAAGSEYEQKCARVIRPVRNHSNYLLSTLLLGNVLVNSALTILIDSILINGVISIVLATLGIVIFGEILPQAVTSRYALSIGSNTMFITKFFMIITFPLSYPISLVLNKLLGKELGVIYSREKLELFIKQQEQMGAVIKDEVDIITGALSLTIKTVKMIMTPIESAFMIPHDSILNFEMLNKIIKTGYTRIPVYSRTKSNITSVLNIKDLTMVDPDDNIPLISVCSFYNRPIVLVPASTVLKDMLDEFKKGKTHLAFVKESDQIIGLVTLEDVIEEIIQAEIVDETDIYTDNIQNKRTSMNKVELTEFSGGPSTMSTQNKLLAFQYLYAEVESFQEIFISFNVLKAFLNSAVVLEFKCRQSNLAPEFSLKKMMSRLMKDNSIIRKGKKMDYAILLISGRVGVLVTKEKLYFETGPFILFCETVLKDVNKLFTTKDFLKATISETFKKAKPSYIPDYEVFALSKLEYIKITAEDYISSRGLTVSKQTIPKMFRESWTTNSPDDEPDLPQSTFHNMTGRIFSKGNVSANNSQFNKVILWRNQYVKLPICDEDNNSWNSSTSDENDICDEKCPLLE